MCILTRVKMTVETKSSEIEIPAAGVHLAADLVRPAPATGLVIFAHGSGSSRRSPRNRHVADILNRGGIATLLIDLLTEREEQFSAECRFDIELLSRRLTAVTSWAAHSPELRELRIGYFGASTGAAAALVSAADQPGIIHAVVSRGGRPDLADAALGRVVAPCLFIVGGNDPVVLQINREAIAQLPPGTIRRLNIIPGATHLFEEPGGLDRVAQLALSWFHLHLKHVVQE